MPPTRKGKTAKWVRNLHYSPASIRLTNGRRLELTPRGQRGDCAPLTADDLEDDKLLLNVDLLVEIITAAEASTVIEKQTINQQARHPSLAAIRNAKDEEYAEDAVKIERSWDERSVTVAETEDGQVIIDRGVGIRRLRAPGTDNYELPHVPQSIDAHEQSEYLADQRAEAHKRAVAADSIEDLVPGGAKINPPKKSP